jgi:hypothetical protein
MLMVNFHQPAMSLPLMLTLIYYLTTGTKPPPPPYISCSLLHVDFEDHEA